MPEEHDVSCTHCGKTLRLKVREESIGNEIEVTCPICNMAFRTIVYPENDQRSSPLLEDDKDAMNDADLRRLQPLTEEFGAALHNAILTNPGVLEVVEKIRAAGYDIMLMLEAVMGCSKRNDAPNLHEPKSLVRDGKVVPGTITQNDENFMRKLHIKF